MSDPAPAPARRIPLSVLLRYGSGQLGAQVFRDTPAVLLPLFLTTMLAVPAWIAGLVVLGPKLWLIICDPMVGLWYDKAKGRSGRTPFLVFGAFGTALAMASLFFLTSYPSPWIAALVVCAVFFLGSTAFSIFSVPYLAIASEISSDPFERNRIIVLRMIFGSCGVLLGVGMPQLLIAHFGGGTHGWHMMSWIFASVCLVSMLVTAIGLRGVPVINAASASGTIAQQFRIVSQNRPFMILLQASFLSNIGQAASYTVIGFVFLYVVKAIWLIPLFILVMASSSLAAKPLWLWLPRQIGKTRCYVLASAVWIAVTVSWFFLGAANDRMIDLPLLEPFALEHLLILLRAVVIGIANGGFVLLALSIMTDTVDAQRRISGVSSEGIFSGVFSAFEKLAFAVGPVIAGFVMSAFGFAASSGAPAPQSDSALLGIVLLYSLVPAGMQVLALAVFSRYRLPVTR